MRIVADDLPVNTPVGYVMSRDVRVCRPDDDLRDAERKMSYARKSRLVVAAKRATVWESSACRTLPRPTAAGPEACFVP
jgi:predicted transcriptional regulator